MKARYILFVADATVLTDAYWLTCAEFNALETAPSYTVNSTEGTFAQLAGTTSTWAYEWTSTEKEPELTLTVDRNNMKETAYGLQVYTGLNNVKFRSPVRPGDTIETRCRIKRAKHPFYFAEGTVCVEGRLCVSAEFSFAITGV